jgi:hypothetical protein
MAWVIVAAFAAVAYFFVRSRRTKKENTHIQSRIA